MGDYQIPVPAFMTPDEFSIPMHEHMMKFDPIGPHRNVTAKPINFKPIYTSPSNLLRESEGPFTVTKMLTISSYLIPMLVDDYPKALLPILNAPMTINIPTADNSNHTGGGYFQNRARKKVSEVFQNRDMCLADGGFHDASGLPALVQK